VGRVAGLFGRAGELKCDPTSAGRPLFNAGAAFRLVAIDGTPQDVIVHSVREHKSRLLLRLCGVESPEEAQVYVGATFFAEADRIQLEPGEYLDRDLAGCALYTEDGIELGIVQSVEHFPSSDMLVVSGRLVPMVSEFIKRIDLRERRIVVSLPEGLL